MKRYIKPLCLIAVLAALFGAALVLFVPPAKYEATSWVFAYSQVPYTVFQTTEGRENYENFLATQFALVKSPMVLQEAVKDARLAQVQELQKQKDQVRWLEKNISVQRKGKSEYFTISFRSSNPKEALAVNQAVTDAYMERYRNDMEKRENQLVADLMQEKTSYENQVKIQQKAIQELSNQIEQDTPGSEQAVENARALAFLQEKLERDNMVLNKISERLTALQVESRSPARIVLDQPATLPTVPVSDGRLDIRLPLAIFVAFCLFGLVILGGIVWKNT